MQIVSLRLQYMTAQLNKLPKKYTLKLLASVLVLMFAVVSGVSVSRAWLSSRYEAESVSVSTGTTPAIPVEMWTYTTSAEGTEGWEVTEADISSEGYAGFTGAITADSVTSSTRYQIKSLNMGSIKNLMTTEEDNFVYLKFTINRYLNGDSQLEFIASQPANYISAYYTSGNNIVSVPDNVITQLEGLNSSKYMNFKYILSDKSYDNPDAIYIDLGTVERPDPFVQLPMTESNKVTNVNDYYLDATNTIPESGDCYYLYIRISPILRTFSYASKELFSYMPCTLFFDWDMELTVH